MTRTTKTLPAYAFWKIEERMGRKDAAKALGISPGNWTKIRNGEQVNSTMELAARHILAKLDPTQTILVHCPKDKANLLEIFCRGLEVDTLNITLAQG